MRTRYLIAGRVVDEDDASLQEVLASVYETTQRPRCLCVAGGVEMYISRFSSFVVKRMPGTGHRHAPWCDSFGLVDTSSGRIHHRESVEIQPNGRMRLRLGFALRQVDEFGSRSTATSRPREASKPARLSLLALLHLLWEEAGFNKWTPRMEGKRHWGLIRHFLLQAASDCEVGHKPLLDYLLLPEPFHVEKKQEIQDRLQRRLQQLEVRAGSGRHLLILIGPLKSISAHEARARVAVRHLSEMSLHADEFWSRKLRRHHEIALGSAESHERLNIVIACTIAKAREGEGYWIDSAALMSVSKEWIPVSNRFEAAVADALIRSGRSFVKVMKYDAPNTHGCADFVLRDTEASRASMDIIVAGSQATLRAKQRSMRERPAGWVWRTTESLSMPAFPSPSASTRTTDASRKNRTSEYSATQ